MNCTEFEIAAQRAVETRNSLAQPAVEHLATCADCRQAWELQRWLNETIDVWRMVQPSMGLADAVLAELATSGGSDGSHSWDSDDSHSAASTGAQGRTVSRSTSAAGRQNRSAAFAMVAVAACLVIAALFASQFGGNAGHELARTGRGQKAEVAQSDARLDVSRTLTEVFSDLKTEYREMANETTAIAREMVIAFPQRVDISALPQSSTTELLPDSSDMVRMLEPIGSRVESAFGFLWNAIPSELPSG